jgi:hypothetical protein
VPADREPVDQRVEGRAADRPPTAKATWITHLPVAEIAQALGTRIPMWVDGTRTEEAVTRSRAYDRTFPCPTPPPAGLAAAAGRSAPCPAGREPRSTTSTTPRPVLVENADHQV